MPVITVSQINRYIGFKLKGDKNLQGVMIKGEISDFVHHFRSGHMYFMLKDSESAIKAVMFASAASRLKFTPEDGMAVVCSGSISVYERDGAYQLYVNDIIPEGAGKKGAALEQLKKKLAAEGIFDSSHKRAIPSMPKKIGAVTSLNGAAIRDIINVISRRYPIGEIYAVNAIVQGENAPDSICRGIFKAETAGCDVIIVGRGGGSSEDLSAFNTEKVVRAIYNCKVPVISAVGHETDFSISDLAADLRAPTPSAAAELAVPSIDSLYERIVKLNERAERSALTIFDRATERFISLNSRLSVQSPKNRLHLNFQKLENLHSRLKIAYERCLEKKEKEVSEKITRLDGLSPLKILSRGYSLTYKDEKLIRNSDDIEIGDELNMRFGSGGAKVKVIEKW